MERIRAELDTAHPNADKTVRQKRLLCSYELQIEAILRDDGFRQWYIKKTDNYSLAPNEQFYEEMAYRLNYMTAHLGNYEVNLQ